MFDEHDRGIKVGDPFGALQKIGAVVVRNFVKEGTLQKVHEAKEDKGGIGREPVIDQGVVDRANEIVHPTSPSSGNSAKE